MRPLRQPSRPHFHGYYLRFFHYHRPSQWEKYLPLVGF
jgi:hypothetical protein